MSTQTEDLRRPTEEGYVGSHAAEKYDGHNGPILKLGLGKSPIGGAPELKQLLSERDPYYDLADYDSDPHHIRTRELIISGIGLRGIGHEAVILNGNGSYGAGDEVIRYLALNGCKNLLVTSYSFPNVAQWAIRHGMEYQPVAHPADPLNPQASLERISRLSPGEIRNNVVYIDCPNNPFGYTDLDLVRQVTRYVKQSGGYCILDMAFGEVLGQDYQAIQQEALEKDNVICLGSLTKTQGFAGLRTGWAILPETLAHNGFTGPQRMVFGLNNEADFVCQQLFSPGNGSNLAKTHALRVAEYNRLTNLAMYTQLEQMGLTIHTTLLETSIQVVSAQVPDLYHILMSQGVETESLNDYSGTLAGREGYGHQAVRILTPGPGQLGETIRRIGLALC